MKTKVRLNPALKTQEHLCSYRVNAFDMNAEVEIKEGKYTVQEPTWDIVVEAYKYLTSDNGKLDLITPGKIIYDLCVTEIDEELTTNQLLLTVCNQLAMDYVFPTTMEIKKNKEI